MIFTDLAIERHSCRSQPAYELLHLETEPWRMSLQSRLRRSSGRGSRKTRREMTCARQEVTVSHRGASRSSQFSTGKYLLDVAAQG